MNMIPMDCLKFLSDADKWVRDEKSWLDFKNSASNSDSLKFHDTLSDAFVTQSHGTSAFSFSRKATINVLEAECICSEKKYRVYDNAILPDFLTEIAENGFSHDNELDQMAGSLVAICDRLSDFCVGGTINIQSCGQGHARWTSRTITIDTSNRTC